MDSCISPQGRHRPLECKPSTPCGFCTKHHASHGQRRARLVCCTEHRRAYGAVRVKSSAVHRAFDALVLKLSDEFNDEISETMTDDSNAGEATTAGADAAATTTAAAAEAAPQHIIEAASASPPGVVEERAAAAAGAQYEQAASSQPARTRARTAAAEPAAPLTRARRNQKLVEQIAAASSSPPSTAPGRSAKRQRDARGAFLPNQAQSAGKASKKRCVYIAALQVFMPMHC
eukprot:2153-Heterococcus_DN1.PRE.2